jgi:predicted nuclease of restriction endonuclease-like (RecB) superfamily
VNEILDLQFYTQIREILATARNKVYSAANFAMVEAYWHIGKSIVEKQGGETRAEYGAKLLPALSAQMVADFGKGFTVTNLQNMRLFYLAFPKSYALRTELSWTHYRLLMRVESEQARQFYLDECVKSVWSTRQLERQINSFFYERLLSSQNKGEVAAEIQSLEPAKTPEDVIRDPYVLEFLGLLFLKATWNRLLSSICKNFCWSWGAVFPSWPDKSDLPSMADISISTLFSTIIF